MKPGEVDFVGPTHVPEGIALSGLDDPDSSLVVFLEGQWYLSSESCLPQVKCGKTFGSYCKVSSYDLGLWRGVRHACLFLGYSSQ